MDKGDKEGIKNEGTRERLKTPREIGEGIWAKRESIKKNKNRAKRTVTNKGVKRNGRKRPAVILQAWYVYDPSFMHV